MSEVRNNNRRTPISKKLKKKLDSVPENTQVNNWKVGICDCCQDLPLACSMLVYCNATGQIQQRVSPSKKCITTSFLLWFIFLCEQVLVQVSVEYSKYLTYEECFETLPLICYTVTDSSVLTIYNTLMILSGSLALILSIITTIIICRTRGIIRTRDSLSNNKSDKCNDCCVSYFCQCCALFQMFKQEDITSTNYRLCSEIGTQV